jgi:hypothetical protein
MLPEFAGQRKIFVESEMRRVVRVIPAVPIRHAIADIAPEKQGAFDATAIAGCFQLFACRARCRRGDRC